MPKKFLPVFFSIVIAILFISPRQASAANTQGYVVHTPGDCSSIYGFVCDPDALWQSIEVDFWNGGNWVGSTSSSYHWDAGSDAWCGGYGNYGFTFPIPDSIKDGQNRYVTAYGISVNSGGGRDDRWDAQLYLAGGTDMNINCAPPPPPIPPAPSGLSASCASPGTTNRISWNAVSGATFYSAYAFDTAYGIDWSRACTAPNSCQRVYSPSASFTSTPGHNYQWYITAGNSSGESGVSGTTDYCTPLTPPPAPSGLSASCASPGTAASMSWNAVSGAEWYSVYAQTPGSPFNWGAACTAPNFCKRVSSSTTSFTTVAGSNYNWYVTAGKTVNGVDYETSVVAGPNFHCSANPKGWVVHTSDNCSAGGWVCDPDNFGIPIQVDFWEGGNWVGSTSSSYHWDAGSTAACGGYGNPGYALTIPEWIKDGATHYVSAYGISVNSAGARDNLNNVQLSGSPIAITCPPPIPPAPAGLSASCASPGTTGNFNWGAVSGATSYNVFLSTSGHNYDWSTCASPNICLGPISGTSYNYSNLTPGTGYQWYAASCNISGCSLSSTGPNFYCTPPCDIASCTGSYTDAPTNNCATNNAFQRDCTYTTYSGGGSCTQAPAPDQPRTIDNCNPGLYCVSGVCTPPPPSACGIGAARATGLVSTPAVNGNFNTSGACVNDIKATFTPYKIPSYDVLKSLYYTQSKTANLTPIPAVTIDSVTDNTITNYTNAAGVSVGPLTYTGTAVIFIDNSLSITGDITGSVNGGLVFVVGGDVNIAQNVTTINAVIISSGTIYTAGAGCSTNITPANKLTINGSLISIYKDQPQTFSCTSASPPAGCPKINFCRTLNNNFYPAEKIIIQPKYLVIFKDLFADTIQKWSEIQ